MPRYIDVDALWRDVTSNIGGCGDVLEIIESQQVVTINDTADEIKVTNCNHNAEVGKKVSSSCGHENGKDIIYRQDAIDAINTWDKFGVDERGRLVRWHVGLELYVYLRDVLTAIVNLPSAQPEEDCDTCKHGYFGDAQCERCRVRYPSHYERRTE